MNSLQQQQAFSVLVGLTMSLFILSGFVRPPEWRRRLRIGAIAVFVIAAVFAIALVVLWLLRLDGKP